MRLSWLWSAIIILSVIAVSIAYFVMPGTILQPMLMFWFLIACPGMVVVRFLRLNDLITEWTLAFALSFSIDALVASVLLYAGRWSPTTTLIILIGFCFGGELLQVMLLLNNHIHAFSINNRKTF